MNGSARNCGECARSTVRRWMSSSYRPAGRALWTTIRSYSYRPNAKPGWLAGIVVNLLTYSGYYDIALRDFGLMLAALALARLASRFDPPGLTIRRRL